MDDNFDGSGRDGERGDGLSSSMMIDSHFDRKYDSKVKNAPKTPLTKGERDYLKMINFERCRNAYVRRMYSSGHVDKNNEIKSDLIGEAFILMENILNKFDKSKFKSKITGLVYINPKTGKKTEKSVEQWLQKGAKLNPKNNSLEYNSVSLKEYDIPGKSKKKSLSFYFILFFNQGINFSAWDTHSEKKNRGRVSSTYTGDETEGLELALSEMAHDPFGVEASEEAIAMADVIKDLQPDVRNYIFKVFVEGYAANELRVNYSADEFKAIQRQAKDAFEQIRRRVKSTK